jgi:protein phosphatase
MIRVAGATDPGRQRENNEDAFLIVETLGAAILADGMGGQNCGEVGSELTISATSRYLRHPEDGLNLEELAMEAIRAANREVLEAARLRQECQGMGSTVVLALWRPPEIVIANVGDSRAYLFRDGELRQLSYDQTFANELRTRLGFSEDRLLTLPNRNVITMAVGAFEHVLIRTHAARVQAGDRILLCSDGLFGPVSEPAIAAILSESSSVYDQVEKLILTANENGGPDNVTAVLVEFGDECDE